MSKHGKPQTKLLKLGAEAPFSNNKRTSRLSFGLLFAAKTKSIATPTVINQGQLKRIDKRGREPDRLRAFASRPRKFVGSVQPVCRKWRSFAARSTENIGAGEGNRTLVFSLEGCCSTIELHPHRGRSTITPRALPQPLLPEPAWAKLLD
jgi:hypothetical protein